MARATSRIDRTISIEDLVREHPESVAFLMDRGIKCLACGEPLWGTLENSAREKGYNDEEIDRLVRELNQFISKSNGSGS